MRNIPHRLVYLNSSAGGAVCGGYGTFRTWSLAGGGGSSWLGVRMEISVGWAYLGEAGGPGLRRL